MKDKEQEKQVAYSVTGDENGKFKLESFKMCGPSREFYKVKILTLGKWELEPLFLNQGGSSILRIVAHHRYQKLYELHSQLLPTVAYYPEQTARELRDLLPNRTPAGEVLLDPASRLNYALRKGVRENLLELKEGRLRSSDNNLDELLQALDSYNAIYIKFNDPILGRARKKINSIYQLIPVSKKLGFPSRKRYHFSLIFNGLFFLMEPTDMTSFHSHFGQPYGFLKTKKDILLPPLFRRGSLLFTDGEVKLTHLCVEDVGIKVGGKTFIPGQNCQVFTRVGGVKSPKQTNRVHLAIVNRTIKSYKENGELQIPDAGFVLAVSKKDYSLKKRSKVEFELNFDLLSSQVEQGLQVGPALIDQNKRLTSFEDEEFAEKIPPTVFPLDWAHTSAARLAIGTTRNGKLVICAVEGCSDTYQPGLDSRGMTLGELTTLLKEREVVNALNLDGGGSMQMYFQGASCVKSADRKGLPHCSYERPVPLVLACTSFKE